MDRLYLVVPATNGENVTVNAWQDLDKACTSAQRMGGVLTVVQVIEDYRPRKVCAHCQTSGEMVSDG